MNNNWELIAQRNIFDATGLKIGDKLVNPETGETGTLYLSDIGYACVMLSNGRRVIWGDCFRKE